MRLLFTAIWFSILISSAQASVQLDLKVEKFNLGNGLTVLLYEDHSVPLVSYHTWFRVGSKDEEVGVTGIAHLFEHMMFRGSKKYTGEQFDTLLQANGATNNAFTSQDYTGYYINLPSSTLELVMDMESDRMQNLSINLENMTAEREVVKEERRYRYDANPQGLLHELLYATTFRVHPYRWLPIGSMEDISRISVEKAQEFYRLHYAPNNAVLVLAGDFQTDKVKNWINKYYAPIPAQNLPPTVRPAEPKQTSQRVQTLRKEVQNTTFAVAYHTPKAGETEAYALDLLANILGKGSSSRLYKRMVYKDQIASGVDASNSTHQDSGLFVISVAMKPGADFTRSQRTVYGEVWRPRNLKIENSELEAAKNQIMKSYVDSLKSLHGKAEMLALNEILFKDYSQFFKDLEMYNKVSAEDIRKVAQKYLAPEQSTLVILKPK